MIERLIPHSKKDDIGDITAIGKPRELWSPVQIAQAIKDIESNAYQYYSQNPNHSVPRSKVDVVNDSKKGKYLRTVADGILQNNLDNLPNL